MPRKHWDLWNTKQLKSSSSRTYCDYLACTRISFLTLYEHLYEVPLKKRTWKKNNNFESSDKLLTGYRLKTVCCFVTIGNWLLHHIKAPCQVGAFGRSTMSEYFFPLMFSTPYSFSLTKTKPQDCHSVATLHSRCATLTCSEQTTEGTQTENETFPKNIWSVLMFVLNKKKYYLSTGTKLVCF